jgi:hypothetical protein
MNEPSAPASPAPAPSFEVVITNDPEAFAPHAAGWLAADPVPTNVVATVLEATRRGEPVPDGSLWITVRSGADVVAAAMRTPPFNLYLPPVPPGVGRAVAAALHAAGQALPGVTGGTASAAEFVEAWTAHTGLVATLSRSEGLHVLGTLVPAAGVGGRPRPAGPADAALCTDWETAFQQEAVPDRPMLRQQVAESVARRIERGTLLLWDDGAGPVSLACWHLPAAGVSRIGPVYTPPEQRCHGYAAAVTAAASEVALAAGAEHVMLFTDLANPTSNGVYARIGYRRVGDASEWTFSAGSPTPPPRDQSTGGAPASPTTVVIMHDVTRSERDHAQCVPADPGTARA